MMKKMCSIIKAISLVGILVSFSSATKVNKLSMGKESSVILIDLLPEAANKGEDITYSEWIIETQHDRILFVTLSTTDGSPLDEEQLQSLTMYDARDSNPIKFTSSTSDSGLEVSSTRSAHSTGNSIVINYHPNPAHRLTSTPLQLKIEKAADCPVNIGGFSSCGRIADQVSCYCATFVNRTWDQTRLFCNQNGMRFVAIESYDEDTAIWNAWGGQGEAFWIGLNDFGQEGNFVWEATGGKLSAGYKNWKLGEPNNGNGEPLKENCAHIGLDNRQGWNDYKCDFSYVDNELKLPLGGICELQP